MARSHLLASAAAGLAFTCALLPSTRASAQAPAARDAKAAQVSEVQVVAPSLEDTLPEALAQTGVQVDVVTEQAIKNGGYLDVAQSIQALAPGFYVLPYQGPFGYVQLSLLGSRTEDVLWLVDGVRINNRLYASTTPLDTLPSSIIDRIEVLEGGQSLFYGTQAIAGAVNIVTKPLTASLSGSATGAADTNSERHLDLNGSDSFGRNHLQLYASADKSDGYLQFRPQDYQPSATDRRRAFAVVTLGGKYAYDFTDQLHLTLFYQHTNADLSDLQPYRVEYDVNRRKEDLATVKLDYDVSDRLGFYLKAYYHNWHTTYDTDYNDLTVPGQIDNLYQDAFWGYHDYGINALGKYVLTKGLEAYFGYDFQRYAGRDEVLVIEPETEQTQAGFAQLRLTPDMVPHLRLAAGVRYTSPTQGQDSTIWNVSGQYDLPANLYLKGELGTNFRLPTAEELYANDPDDERGDPNIKPEHSTSLNLEFGGHFDVAAHPVRWELTGFARNISNLIDYDSFDSTTDQYVFGNVPGVVRVRGAMISADASLTDALKATLSYTYNRSRESSGAQLDEVPVSLLKASLDYHPSDHPFGATFTLNYTGDVSTLVGPNETPYGDYVIVDLSGRYFLDRARHQTINLSLTNLFDQTYGVPRQGCADVSTDGPYDCSSPYTYVNLGQPRTFRASYTYSF